MNQSNLGKFVVIFVVVLAGLVLLFQSPQPAPETMSRQAAVQSAYAPFRSGNGTFVSTGAAEENVITYGEPVSPVEVDLASVSSRVPEVDKLRLAYETGKLDLDEFEGPVSDAVFHALVEESKQQPVDPTVQNYDADVSLPTSPNQLNSLDAGVNFKAIDYTQSLSGVPPDPDIMVGKDHIVVGVNTSFQVFDKSGKSLYGPVLYEDFWFNEDEGESYCGSHSPDLFFFDPFSQYDEENGRYVLGITANDDGLNGGNNGWACIAVSQTDSAVGGWYLYSFDGNPGNGTDYFFDYPHLGVGQDALYLGANMFIDDDFVRNHIFALEKDAMYAGEDVRYIKFNKGVGGSYFTIQPAKIKGYNTRGWPFNPNEPHYFVDAQFGNGQNTLTVWKLSDPWQNPKLEQAGTVTVNTYNFSVEQPQFNGNNIEGNDNRMLDVEYWNGKLWASHTVGCNPGGGTVNCVRWYEIDIRTGTPSLVQQGTFVSNGEFRSFPDLAVDACGNMLVGYTRTSSNIYPSVYIAGREAGDAAGTLKNETLVRAGEIPYTSYDELPFRWGDYTGMALDPDGKTFWYIGEYSRSQIGARWSTWVASYTWSGCVPPPPFEPTDFVYLPAIIK